MSKQMLLQDYGDGMRPAPGRYRCDELEIGPDGRVVEFVGLRPWRCQAGAIEIVAPMRDKWGRPLG